MVVTLEGTTKQGCRLPWAWGCGPSAQASRRWTRCRGKRKRKGGRGETKKHDAGTICAHSCAVVFVHCCEPEKSRNPQHRPIRGILDAQETDVRVSSHGALRGLSTAKTTQLQMTGLTLVMGPEEAEGKQNGTPTAVDTLASPRARCMSGPQAAACIFPSTFCLPSRSADLETDPTDSDWDRASIEPAGRGTSAVVPPRSSSLGVLHRTRFGQAMGLFNISEECTGPGEMFAALGPIGRWPETRGDSRDRGGDEGGQASDFELRLARPGVSRAVGAERSQKWGRTGVV